VKKSEREKNRTKEKKVDEGFLSTLFPHVVLASPSLDRDLITPTTSTSMSTIPAASRRLVANALSQRKAASLSTLASTTTPLTFVEDIGFQSLQTASALPRPRFQSLSLASRRRRRPPKNDHESEETLIAASELPRTSTAAAASPSSSSPPSSSSSSFAASVRSGINSTAFGEGGALSWLR